MLTSVWATSIFIGKQTLTRYVFSFSRTNSNELTTETLKHTISKYLTKARIRKAFVPTMLVHFTSHTMTTKNLQSTLLQHFVYVMVCNNISPKIPLPDYKLTYLHSIQLSTLLNLCSFNLNELMAQTIQVILTL